MDKYEFLANLGVPSAVIDTIKSNTARSGSSSNGSPKAAQTLAPAVAVKAPAAGVKAPAAALKGQGAKVAKPVGKLPQPMLPDCKAVHGKMSGPSNHLLCGTHGHVL